MLSWLRTYGSVAVVVLQILAEVIKFLAKAEDDLRRDEAKRDGRAETILEASNDLKAVISAAGEARRAAVAAHRYSRVFSNDEPTPNEVDRHHP